MSEPPTTHCHALLELTRVRFLEFVRDPAALFWVFGFPILLTVVLGIAFRDQAPERYSAAVVGEGAAELSLRLTEASRQIGANQISFLPMPVEEARAELRSGRIELSIHIEGGSAAERAFLYRYDPKRPGVSAARLAADNLLQKVFGRKDAIQVREERVQEAGGRYVDYFVPGLIGLNIMGSSMWGMGYALVDSRRRKLLKLYAVTPMNRAHFLLSFALSRLLFLGLEIGLLILFGYAVFDVEVRGSFFLLGMTALLGTVAFMGLSFLIASRTESTEVAAGWMNFVQLPMWLFSGSFFSYHRFPDVVIPWIRALPLTAINDAARSVMNRGAGLSSFWLEWTILALWGGVSFALALRMFRWK